MKVVIFKDIKKSEIYWRLLENTQVESNVFLTYDFNLTLSQGLPKNESIYILVIFNSNNEPIILFPTKLSKKKLLFEKKVVSFINPGDKSDILVNGNRKESSKAIIFALDYFEKNNLKLNFVNLAVGSNFFKCILTKKEYSQNMYVTGYNPILKLPSKFEDLYKDQIIGSKRRYYNGFKKNANLVFSVENKSSFNEAINLFQFQQQILQKKNVNRRDIFSTKKGEALANFYKENARSRLFSIRNAETGEMLSFVAGFLDVDVFRSYTTGYHPEYGSRLGRIIYFEIWSVLISEGVKLYDFGAGLYPWKMELTDYFETRFGYQT